MNKQQEEQLRQDVNNIFVSGPNEQSVFEMVKRLTDKIEVDHNKELLDKTEPASKSAFPFEMPKMDHPRYVSDKGMDLRDYFAGKSLPSTIVLHGFSTEKTSEWHAKKAYQIADAMMKQRSSLQIKESK